VQASDVIILDTPHGDFIEISSSSYDLSLFSSMAGSDHDKGVVAALRKSSSVSIGDLWPKIDSSCGTDLDGAFTTATSRLLEASTSCLLSGVGGRRKEKVTEGMRDVIEGATLGQAPGPSSASPKVASGDSTKSKAAQILADASGDISPRMKRPFAERRYSPSTGMDQSKWEIILEQHLIMGLIVKDEVVSEPDE
jgi:hypothetical protein